MGKNINLEGVRKMKHALGFDNVSPKRGKFSAYRNYYDSGGKQDPDWDEMVEQGYAKRGEGTGCYKGWWYSVTPEGIKLLEGIVGVRIVETR